MALRCAVELRRPSSERAVMAETRNLSSDGFYCVAPEPFEPGEVITCTIVLPLATSSPERRSLCCQVTVLRVDRADPDEFGIACHTDDYSLSWGDGVS